MPDTAASLGSPSLHTERTFFGVLRVIEQAGERQLVHGTTLHGVERLAGPLAGEPLTYYGRRGPLGDVFAAYPHLDRVDAIGLGVGTLAAYGRPGQQMTFYELDPAITRIASDPRFFTFLRDSPANVKIVLGDGRRTIAHVPDGSSDLVIVDAFSSDSIPVHLLTREAVELYLRKLRPGGLIAFHVTNRHLELAPVVARAARALGLEAVERNDRAEGARGARTPSRWLVIRARRNGSRRCSGDPAGAARRSPPDACGPTTTRTSSASSSGAADQIQAGSRSRSSASRMRSRPYSNSAAKSWPTLATCPATTSAR